MSQGKVVQIIGAVVDFEFPQDAVPKVYDALKVTEGNLEGLVLEVQQQLGGGIVRAIAMGTTDGLRRGIIAETSGAGSFLDSPEFAAKLERRKQRSRRISRFCYHEAEDDRASMELADRRSTLAQHCECRMQVGVLGEK